MMPLALRRKARTMEKVENSTALHACRTLCLDAAINWSGFTNQDASSFRDGIGACGPDFESL
jgi:hypothetical protein